LKLFALLFVLLLPIVLLAIRSAVKSFLASGAYLVFTKIALGRATEVALLHQVSVFLAILGNLSLIFKFAKVIEPLLRRVVHPRIDELDRFALDLLLGKLLR